jgi:zinc transport system substrate-binding protein
LATLLPDHASDLEKNRRSLAADLDALDASFRALPKPPLLCSHPAYNYIARRYGWDIRNLNLDPGEMPGGDAMAEIAQILESHPAKVLIWEDAPAPEIAEKMAATFGLTSIVFSPCEQPPRGGDYIAEMRANLARLRSSIVKD